MDKLRALIHKMTPTTGTFVVSEISEKILTAAEEQLNGELAAMQRDLVLRVIATEVRSAQYEYRRQERSITLRADVDKAFNEVLHSGHVFTKSYRVDEHDTWKAVADMTGEDHRFVADTYEKTAMTTKLMAEFHRQVAKKVGKKRTGDVMDETKYLQLQASIFKAA